MIALVLAVLAVTPAEAKKAQTVAAMHSAMHAVVSLQPYLTSPTAFRDPANASVIGTELEALSNLKHHFMMPGRQNVALETLAGVFGDHVDEARAEFKAGNTEATRARLRGITSLCFACHTRQSVSKDFVDVAKVVESMNLPPLRKAEFFATTRQFDLALAAWNTALEAAPKSEAEAFDQTAAMRQYVAVLVRVRDDRKASVAALSKQLARTDLPVFSRRILEQWLRDAKVWQADDFVASTATAAALVAKAGALIASSGAAQSPISDETRFIPTLRATGYLHAALEKEPQAGSRVEALYLLGVATAATLDPLLWDLDSLYLEACIREKPHSGIARQCADRMYDRAWFGWTGSGGTRIPPDVAQRLGELRVLASPIEPAVR